MSDIPVPPPSLPPSPRRKSWLMAFLVLMIFIAGLMSGVGLTVIVAVHRLRYAAHHPELAPAGITAYLDRRLHLTPDQATRIRDLIAERQRHLQSLRRQIQPQLRTELDALRDDIAATLTPAQQSRWSTLYEDALHNWLPDLSTTQR